MNSGRLRRVTAVFLISFAARILLNAGFMLLFGAYAVNHVEVWFYTGVASGTHLPTGGLADPSVWVLKAIGYLAPEGMTLHAVEFLGVIASCATAAMLCILVAELYDTKTGVGAGIIYGVMVEPLALTTAGFTHDLIQLPLILACLLFIVKASKATQLKALTWSLAFLVVFNLGRGINQTMYVVLPAAAAYVTYELIRRWRNSLGAYLAYAAVIIIAAVAVQQLILPDSIESMLSALPQGRLGSSDVKPVNMTTIWLRYNILLILLPFGAANALRRRDTIALVLAVSGFLLATYMDRGTRIADLGVAILSAHAVTSKIDKKYFIASAAAVFAGAHYFSDAQTKYWMIFLAAAAAVYYVISRKTAGSILAPAVAVLLVVGVATNTAYIYGIVPSDIVSDAEYAVLKWLSENNKGGMVLAGWDRGYMIEVVANLVAASTPNKIDHELHDVLWGSGELAHERLVQNGIRYVLINSENFKAIKDEDSTSFRMVGGLVYAPKTPPKEPYKDITINMLAEKNGMQWFKLIKSEKDNATGVEVMLYEIR